MVRLKVRPKGLIGWDGRWSVWKSVWRIWLDETEDGPSEVCLKDLIGQDGRWSVWSPSKQSDWTRRKMVRLKSVRRFWLNETEDGPSEARPKYLIGRDGIWFVCSPSKGSDWTRRKMVRLKSIRSIWLEEMEFGPYEDASDLYILPEWSYWTRQNMVRLMFLSSGNASDWLIPWICLLETLMIGWSNGSVFWRLLLTSFYFLFRDFIQPFAINKKRYTNASSFCDEYAVQSTVTRETYKTTVTFVVTYSTPGGLLKLCTMPIRCGLVSVWCSTCITYIEYYDT